MTLHLNDKLSKNLYQPESEPHIILADSAEQSAVEVLLNACPAGLYRLNVQGDITFEAHGCLECGTCRILCDETTFARWRYPQAGCGVTFRFG
ncbi:ferredoxin family protein [Enterobacteriaceae bacterium Kacie_13]|nr:ferredoxin family protein [Enterobacteriaceae bacterium Kacie_13]